MQMGIQIDKDVLILRNPGGSEREDKRKSDDMIRYRVRFHGQSPFSIVGPRNRYVLTTFHPSFNGCLQVHKFVKVSPDVTEQ